jgi:putative ABC transport system substrate-binding protein
MAWPLSAHAQQPGMPVIGYQYGGSLRQGAYIVSNFLKGLSETGFVEGQNVAIEFRWAEGQLDRLPMLAADLVSRKVAVIATPVTALAALAAKAATTTIPIVFSTGTDPVQIGLVTSLNRPGGNVTGITGMSLEVAPKRLGLLQHLLPGATRFVVLVNNPNSPTTEPMITDLQAAAVASGRQIEVVTFDTERDIETAFASLAQRRVDALLVSPDTVLINRRVQVVTLAARHAVPAIYPFREDTEAGGLRRRTFCSRRLETCGA